MTVPLTIILATGGTGGHIFPAQALAEVLEARGHQLALITDPRFANYSSAGTAFSRMPVHVIPAVAIAGGIIGKVRGAGKNLIGFANAWALLKRIRPDVVIGFGGYPSLPTMLAARVRHIPYVIHEQNALLGKTNRMIAGDAIAIASSFPALLGLQETDQQKLHAVGNPVRSGILAVREAPYPALTANGKVHLLVTGGSQGALILGEVVPAAIALLPESLRHRIRITQQVRAEQITPIREHYLSLGIEAEIAAFFTDIPERLMQAHLVIARAGASTVAELTCAGRPAILVPLPSAAEDHQTINAKAMEAAGGAWVIPQPDFTAEALAARLQALFDTPEMLAHAATASHAAGKPDAAEMLANVVVAAANRKKPLAPLDALLQE
jgi:UDP-N-acetylglucosamine--N-acetylmuramyl-(pentapeptide) pyrophosphoryl-undecaprenol N-acetylglucosamine transferase